MQIIRRRADCRACRSRSLEMVFSLRPSPIGDAYVTRERLQEPQSSYPIDLYMCRDCGLAQLIDVIDPSVLYGEYIYLTESSLGLVEHFRAYADHVIERCGLPPGSFVVDLGSNDGTLLRRFQERDMRVLGVEPARHIAADATAQGVETLGEFFDPGLAKRVAAEYGHAAMITANNVFANIDDLTSWLDGVDGLLADNGVFVFESFYLADVVQNMVFDFLYHEHLSAFSVRPVQALVRRAGLELVALERVPTKGGSLRYFAQRPGGFLTADGSVAAMLSFEDQIGLYRKDTYTTFAQKVTRLKEETNSFLAGAKREGKSIAGVGASITGTTLIYHFEIGRHLEYLVDDNPAKQGRFSPGLHLPVFPSTVLTERRPDYAVILAWRYAEPLIQKNQRYLDRGGRFIVPVPQFRIVPGA